MEDKDDILKQPSENMQSGRQIRFTHINEIKNTKSSILNYISQAIEIEIKGLKVNSKQTNENEVPVEFQQILDQNSQLKTSFESLTPGRQRAYLLYISRAKQFKTRVSRIERRIPRILDGKGLND